MCFSQFHGAAPARCSRFTFHVSLINSLTHYSPTRKPKPNRPSTPPSNKPQQPCPWTTSPTGRKAASSKPS